MSNRQLTIFLTLLLCTFAQSASAQTDVYLRVYTKTFQRMEIDLYPFTGEQTGREADEMQKRITNVLSNDLWMSGYFKVNVQSGPPEASSPTPRDGVRPGGALAVISGTFRLEPSVTTITPKLVDRASGRTIVRSDYTDHKPDGRQAIHRIADDIVYSLTGERGIATSKVAYVHETRDQVKEIYIMDYDGENRAPLTSIQSISLSPDWAPDGSRLSFTTFKDKNLDLYIYSLRANNHYVLSKVKGLNSAPAWSPDGKRIALTMSKDGNAEIYLMDVDSKEQRRLTYNPAIDSSPSWSPSNRELVFSSDRTGTPQVYIMDADGLNVRRLTFQGSYNDTPSWSPRGDKITYVSRTDSGFDIYTIDATGENMMRLTDSSGANEDPSWSPNGFALVFSSTRSGQKELYSMFWDGSDQKKLTSGGNNYMPAWSRASK